MASAALSGIAKPWLPSDENAKLSDAAVSMPITSPEAFTNGPPESPASTLALTSIRPDSCSLPPVSSSFAVIFW